jgi:uncharacterized protein
VSRVGLGCVVTLLLFAGCATYAERTEEVHRYFVSGNTAQAYESLQTNRSSLESRNELLHELSLGTLSHHLEEYERSNQEFEQAFRIAEGSRVNWAAVALAQFTNPEVTPYRGEDFEIVLLHYYKALNYLSLNDTEGALVEVRRINIRLAEINRNYGEHANRYTVDAFATYLSGMIYEAAGEHNDAFIAYRNAYDVYLRQYAPLFGVQPPEQLKYDLIRAAARSGLSDERSYYEERFGIAYQPDAPGTGNVLVLWNSGLGPAKSESSINFLVVQGQGGGMAFVNRDMGITIPFVAASSSQAAQLQDLKVVRVAFPQYVERRPLYSTGTVETDGALRSLEKVQDINAIAFGNLEDRMVREMAATLLRIAVKQATEAVARKQNPNLGVLVSVANAISEKADTRNWQTIPYSIHMARLTVSEGPHRVSLSVRSESGTYTDRFEEMVDVSAGETVFLYRHTLDSQPLEVYRSR